MDLCFRAATNKRVDFHVTAYKIQNSRHVQVKKGQFQQPYMSFYTKKEALRAKATYTASSPCHPKWYIIIIYDHILMYKIKLDYALKKKDKIRLIYGISHH